MDQDELGPPLVPGVVTAHGPITVLAVARDSVEPPLLGPREHAVLAETPWPHRRAEWLAGRSVMKQLLRAAGLPAEGVEVLSHPSGAPRVMVGDSPVSDAHVGLTHTRRWVVAAWSTSPVGIDACDDADGPRLHRIGARVFGEGEAEAVGAHRSEQHQAATWAVKEAVLKLDHGGVFDPGLRAVRLDSLTPPLVRGVRLRLLRLPSAAVALAFRGV